jgi:hypothetical protein
LSRQSVLAGRLDDIAAVNPLCRHGDQQFIVQLMDESTSFADQSRCQHYEALRAKPFAGLVGRVVVRASLDEALHGQSFPSP